MTTALEWGEGSASCPVRSLSPEKTCYQFYRRLGGPQGRSGQVRKISPPSGFDPWTFQPLVSRYTDWATRLTSKPLWTQNHWRIVWSHNPNLCCSNIGMSVRIPFGPQCIHKCVFFACNALCRHRTCQRTVFVPLPSNRTNKTHRVGRLEILSRKTISLQDQTQRRWICTTVQGNKLGLLNRHFRVMAAWRLKKVCNVYSIRFLADGEKDRLLGHFCLPSRLTWVAYRQ